MEILISLLVGLGGGLIAWSVAQRRISIENITQERKNWRDGIREKALEAHDAIVNKNHQNINRLHCEFRALLNPNDCNDNKIVELLRPEVEENGTPTERAEKFAELISHLLKHDWERAKVEAGPCLMKINCKRIRCLYLKMLYQPKRTTPP